MSTIDRRFTTKPGWDSVEEHLKEAKSISWDGCHKIYLAMDDEQCAWFQEGYADPPTLLVTADNQAEMLATLHEWFDEGARECGLHYINAVWTDHEDPNRGFVNLIPQFFFDDPEEN